MDSPSNIPATRHHPQFQTRTDEILQPQGAVVHRDENFDTEAMFTLATLQKGHFWWMGRRRFIEHSVKRFLPELKKQRGEALRAIDMGGGAGGWAGHLAQNHKELFSEVALADSSMEALTLARDFVPPTVKRYQIELNDIPWTNHWDACFLLDVLEHLDDDATALKGVAKAMRPGGLIFVTMPAFDFFWSYNDLLAHHKRRYTVKMLEELAGKCHLKLVDARYFNFFLSPLVYLSRMRTPNIDFNDPVEVRKLLNTTHELPSPPLNLTLKAIFDAESPLGHWIRFPWGTSVLGVFQVFA